MVAKSVNFLFWPKCIKFKLIPKKISTLQMRVLDTCVLRILCGIPSAAFLRVANAWEVVGRQPRYTRVEVVAYRAFVRGTRYGTLG